MHNTTRSQAVTRIVFRPYCLTPDYHRLRGSASPVLTATHHSYGSPRLSDFYFDLGSGVRPLNGHSRKMAQTTCFHAKMCLLR